MNLFETFRVSIGALTANRSRALLTMLGVIIGIAAVIILVSFGKGVEVYVVEQFNSIGANVLFVLPSRPAGASLTDDTNPLTTKDAEAIADPFRVPEVLRAAPEYNSFMIVEYEREEMLVEVNGVTPDYQDVRGWYPERGRFIAEEDLIGAPRVAVLGSSTVRKLYPSGIDPIGTTITVQEVPFRVVGIMEERGGGGGFMDENEVVFVPISTSQLRLSTEETRTRDGGRKVNTIYVQAASREQMDAAALSISEVLRERHGIEFQGDEDFSVITQDELLEIVGQITGLLTIFLALLAGISLLVGGIGIMNIMLVSVTERIREIGLRKAIGARPRDILLQFLVESITIAVVGGLIGIAIGILITVAATALVPDLNLVITPDSIILATGVSAMTGVFFGVYPARNAAQLNPIDALRYE